MPNRDYYLKGRDDKTLLAYETYATEMAIMFGADPSMAKTDTQAMVDFEIELANVRDLNDQKQSLWEYCFCLMPLSAIFYYSLTGSFIDGGNQNIKVKTSDLLLANVITFNTPCQKWGSKRIY